MIGPNFTNMNLALGRIDQIAHQIEQQCMPASPAKINGNKERFVDVLDERLKEASKASGIRGKTSYAELQDVIDTCADDYNIDSELIRAMIQVESGWNTEAVSPVGAQGLMQLMPRTAAMLGVKDAFDPEQNIEGGVKYIASLTDKYNGDIEKALAAYNAGPTRVDSGKIPSVTNRYVRNVMAIYHRIREES